MLCTGLVVGQEDPQRSRIVAVDLIPPTAAAWPRVWVAQSTPDFVQSTMVARVTAGRPLIGSPLIGSPLIGRPLIGEAERLSPLIGSPLIGKSVDREAVHREPVDRRVR